MKTTRNFSVAMILALSAIGATAAPVVLSAPSADATVYTPVTVQAKKLKTTLAAALAQFPGKEIILASDINAPVAAPSFVFTDAFSYYSGDGFPKGVRVDGLNVKNFANFKVPFLGGPAEVARIVRVDFTQPTTEFGMTVLAGRVDIPLVDAFDVSVNGVYFGRVPVAPFTTSYFGVSDPDGLQSIVLTPVTSEFFQTGAWIAREIFTK
jgi:hypothetical protein